MTAKRGFDLTVHRRNSKGKVVNIMPYRLYIKDGQQRFERPPGSGYFYGANGELLEQPKAAVEAAQAVQAEEKKADIQLDEVIGAVSAKPGKKPSFVK